MPERAKVDLVHIREAKQRLERLYPDGYGLALAMEVAQVMADAEARGAARSLAAVIAECERRERLLPTGDALTVAELRVCLQRGEHVGAVKEGGDG